MSNKALLPALPPGAALSFSLLLAFLLSLFPAPPARAGGGSRKGRAESLNALRPGQSLRGFSLANLYENGRGRVVGARLISAQHGFVVDLMSIESSPQAFFWIKTPPTTSMGEPHACEHLLLGKGRRGRYVAALEDMSLGSSSAYTGQTHTCYHFNTPAGEDVFYDLFQAKLEALLYPDFTDEEIRREVCHVGVAFDPRDSAYALEEKGTVYTEMVSSLERPYYHLSGPLNKMVYGAEHPLSQLSGGDPTAMRGMVPADLRDFHRATHRLDNMGAIVSLPDEVSLDAALGRLSAVLERIAASAPPADRAAWPPRSNAIHVTGLRDPHPAPAASMEATTYPSRNPADPGYMSLQWPVGPALDAKERTVLRLFLSAFGGGENSNLYRLLIDSRTRRIEPGAAGVSCSADHELGTSPQIYLTGLDSGLCREDGMARVRSLVLEELRRLRDLQPGSDSLDEFNHRVESRLLAERKEMEDYLNSPPMFGFRGGPAGGWLGLLQDLEDVPGFRKSMVMAPAFAAAESLLAVGGNPWRERIEAWGLLKTPPYVVATSPSPEKLEREQAAKEARLDDYVRGFRRRYRVEDDSTAVARYAEEFDARTAEMEVLAGADDLPGFIDNPPMTLDDQLQYEELTLPGGVPLVASTFDNMISATVGLALRLDVIPEEDLLFVPFLPSVLTEIGVVENGVTIPYDEMRERLRREVLSLDAGFDHGYETGRTELVLTGQGGNPTELASALSWMRTCLASPYLDTANLPRMLDVLDQSLIAQRNRMKGPEESWVTAPPTAYRFQEDPLMMVTDCFLTSAHALQRLRWMLTDPGGDGERISLLARDLAGWKDSGREELESRLQTLEAASEEADGDEAAALLARSLRSCLPEIPDADLAEDWDDLCRCASSDLAAPPEEALARIRGLLDLLRRADNARMYMASSEDTRETARPQLSQLAAALDSSAASRRVRYSQRRRVEERLRQREPSADPTYVGLLHPGTRNGALIFSARRSAPYDTDREAILDCLSGQLYGGGGPHGLFMKTWSAGLAYSNGYIANPATGRVSYYAERCPDVSQTMRFVAQQLEEARPDSELADYAVAQVFLRSRAASRYESRARGIAADLADGFAPERVAAYRRAVLEERRKPGFFEELRRRMAGAYGPVLIGYGPTPAGSRDAVFFLVGPEEQFDALEGLLSGNEQPRRVYRLYPRDFWLGGS